MAARVCRFVVYRTCTLIIPRCARTRVDNLKICCTNFGTFSQNYQRRKRVQDQSNSEFMEEEVKKYETGKRWLAKMMGVDYENFTDDDVEESLGYLLPTKLFAKDARPVLKHPTKLFPESKSSFSEDGRPMHAAFYTGAQAFNDLIYDIFQNDKMLREREPSFGIAQNLESSDKNLANQGETKVTKLRWLSHVELQHVLGEEITQKDYEVVIHRLKKLKDAVSHRPDLEEIHDFLEKYQTAVDSERSRFTVQKLDQFGRAHGKGYRKRAMAEVWLVQGDGKITVNDFPLVEYFVKQEDRSQVWHPFIELDVMGQFDVECNVLGGGTTGQAGAIRLAISRALTSTSIDYREPLLKAGLLTRDSRLVERKKPGQKKARKKFAWVKR